MTPDQAIELLYSASAMAKLTKEDHVKCEQARATLLNALHPPDQADQKELRIVPTDES